MAVSSMRMVAVESLIRWQGGGGGWSSDVKVVVMVVLSTQVAGWWMAAFDMDGGSRVVDTGGWSDVRWRGHSINTGGRVVVAVSLTRMVVVALSMQKAGSGHVIDVSLMQVARWLWWPVH